MTTDLTVTIERVDDIPVLLAQLVMLRLAELINQHCPVHGNWSGLGLGETASVWLAHILSCGDHRLNQVRDWVEPRLHTLQGCVGERLTALSFTGDRVAQVLNYLSHDASWQALEADLNTQTLRVYEIEPQRARLDSTTVSGYWEVTLEGLFQFGTSKDHRPDLPQVKVMLSALDPLGLPLVTQVLSGQRADDRLYIPAIEEVRNGVQRRGLLYIGDVKMGSHETRAFLVAGSDYYLLLLSQTQLSQAAFDAYLAPVWTKEQALEEVYRTEAEWMVSSRSCSRRTRTRRCRSSCASRWRAARTGTVCCATSIRLTCPSSWASLRGCASSWSRCRRPRRRRRVTIP